MTGPRPRVVVAAALRRERARSGASLAEVARLAGVAKSTLSQLEAGAGNPSLETLWALSTALGVTPARLIEPEQPVVTVLRAGEGPILTATASDYAATLLAASPSHVSRDLYLVRAEPGPARDSDPHAAGIVEHVILATGRALVGPIEDPVELAPGDYVRYPGDRAHTFGALEPGTTATLVSEHG